MGQNSGQAETITLERVRAVRAGLHRLDMQTVRLRINDHNFCIDLPELLQVVDMLAKNCSQFQQQILTAQCEVKN